jgi:uncharacterized membrane protein
MATPDHVDRVVRAEVGVVISSMHTQSLPGNEMHVIFEIADVPDISVPSHFTGCHLVLNQSQVNPDHGQDTSGRWLDTFLQQLTELCGRFRRIDENFNKAHEMMTAHNRKLHLLSLAVSPNRRTTNRARRGFWQGVRQLFNIGSHQRQVSLARRMRTLQVENRLGYGQVNNMKMVLRATMNATQSLTHALRVQKSVITEMHVQLQQMTRLVVEARESNWIFNEVLTRSLQLSEHAFMRGSLGGQLLQLQGQMLRDRYQGVVAAVRGRLSNLLIDPQMIRIALKHFEYSIQAAYPMSPSYRLLSKDPNYYYLNSKVIITRVNGLWYLEMPVNVFQISGRFRTYRLANYYLPAVTSSQDRYTRCTGFSTYVAINEAQTHYIPIGDVDFNTECLQAESTQCLAHKALYDLSSSGCTVSIITNNSTGIREHCTIEYAVLTTPPRGFVVYLDEGRYYVMNYGRDPWSTHCNGSMLGNIQRSIQLHFHLGCGCHLIGGSVSTPTFLDETCVDAPSDRVKVDSFQNIIYLSYLLNQSVSAIQHNISNDQLRLPKEMNLIIPTYQPHEAVDDDIVFDLEKLTKKLYQSAAPALSYLENDVNELFEDNVDDYFSYLLTIVSISLSGIVMIGIVILCIKSGQMGRTLAVFSAVPTVKCNKLVEVESTVIMFLQFITVGILVALVLTRLCRWIFGTRLSTLLCKQWSVLRRDPETEVRLEMNSARRVVDFHITWLHAVPDALKVIGEIDPLGIQPAPQCLGCRVAFNWDTVQVLHTSYNATTLERQVEIDVPLPIYMTVHDVRFDQLRMMVNESCRVALLIGTGTCYTRHAIGHTGFSYQPRFGSRTEATLTPASHLAFTPAPCSPRATPRMATAPMTIYPLVIAEAARAQQDDPATLGKPPSYLQPGPNSYRIG